MREFPKEYLSSSSIYEVKIRFRILFIFRILMAFKNVLKENDHLYCCRKTCVIKTKTN